MILINRNLAPHESSLSAKAVDKITIEQFPFDVIVLITSGHDDHARQLACSGRAQVPAQVMAIDIRQANE